mgnify:CR=1 FL=1
MPLSAGAGLLRIFGAEALEESRGFEHGFVGAVEIGTEGGVDGWFLGAEFVGVDDVGGGLRGDGEREAADESGAVHGGGLDEIEALGDVGACHPEREGLERDALGGADVFEGVRRIGEFADEVGFVERGDFVFGLGDAGIAGCGGLGNGDEVFVVGDHDDIVYQTDTVLQVGFW